MFAELDADLLTRYQLAHPLPGCVAEGSPLLRRVVSCNTHSMLHLVGVEDGDRVAVSNVNNGAYDDGGFGIGG